MEDIKLNSLSLSYFDKTNKCHLDFLLKLLNDDTIKTRFQGILSGLMSKNEIFNKGFLVKDNNILIGYIHISSYMEEEQSVYLRNAIDKDLRNKGYGKKALKETSEYLFNNFDKIKDIKLKIADDNISNQNTAASCGAVWIKDDIYTLKKGLYKRK